MSEETEEVVILDTPNISAFPKPNNPLIEDPTFDSPLECWNCSIFDVDRDGDVDYIDAGRAWSYIHNLYYPKPTTWISMDAVQHNLTELYAKKQLVNQYYDWYAERLYDVNCDGIADVEDVLLIMENYT